MLMVSRITLTTFLFVATGIIETKATNWSIEKSHLRFKNSTQKSLGGGLTEQGNNFPIHSLAGAVDLKCEKGTYYSTSTSTCITCPSGTYSSTGAYACCPDGSYTSPSSSICLQCSVNSYSVRAAACSSCDTGSYATLPGSTACTGQEVIACPAGSGVLSDQLGCYLCPINTYNTGSSSQCKSCPTGSIALSVGSISCVVPPCSAGSYSTTRTSVGCQLCPAGTYDTMFGSGSACTSCKTGTYSAAIGSISLCTSCSPGSFADVSAATSCAVCPAGTYTASSGSSSCSGCAAGKASSSIGAVSSSTCSTCPAGKYSSKAAAICAPCTPGYYSPNEQSSSCTSCPVGTYNPSYSSTSQSSCLTCPLGYVSSAAGASACIICDAGKYSSQGSICISCTPGTYSNAGVSSCADCAAGFYSLSDSSTCLACSAGYYSSVRSGSCSKCGAGKYSVAGSASCSSCPAGSYSAEGSPFCSLCPAGSYTASAGSATCGKCSAGSYAPSAGLTSCQPCSEGFYVGTEGASFCLVCPIGSVAVEGSSSCTVCKGGTYATAYSSSCSSCAGGKYSGDGATSCLSCAAGTLSLSGSATCSACSAGTYASSMGSSFCQACPPGSYSSGGASVCSLCPKGTYSSSVQAVSSSTCQSCPAGTHQPALGAISIDSCLSCVAGTYSSAASFSCYACGANTYSAPLSSSCSSCPSGFSSVSNAAGCSVSTPFFPLLSYAASVNIVSIFLVPGAVGYTLQFDPRSETEVDTDFVYAFTGRNSTYVYKNSGSSWPSTYIPSYTGIKIQFTSDESLHMRGFSVSIIPNITLTKMPTAQPSFRPSFSTAQPSFRPSFSPSYPTEQWMCVSGSSYIEKTCSSQSCVPGLVAFIGKGYDITKGTGIGGYDIGQQVQPIRDRVYDYYDISKNATIGGKRYTHPSDLDVQPMDVTQMSDTTFNQQIDSVSSFQVSIDSSVGLSTTLKANPPASKSTSSMMSVMTKGLSVSAEYTKTVSDSIFQKQFSYSHFATVTKAAYNINPRSDGQVCASQFFVDLKALPLQFDKVTYFNFLRKYGTHIITGTNIGGSVRTSVTASQCSFSTSSDQYIQASAYYNGMASLVASTTMSSFTAFSKTVTKKTSNVCGGDSAVYLNNPLTTWSSTILSNPVCSNKYNLLPLWMTLSSKSPYRANLENATYAYIESVISASSLSTDTVTLCESASGSSASGSASSHRQKLFYGIPILTLLVSLVMYL